MVRLVSSVLPIFSKSCSAMSLVRTCSSIFASLEAQRTLNQVIPSVWSRKLVSEYAES